MNEECMNLFAIHPYCEIKTQINKALSQSEINLESVEEYGVEEVGCVQANLNRNG